MLNVYLLPGFMASDLGVIANGDKVWWDPNVAALLGVGSLRLQPNGIDPGPPDGEALGVDPLGQSPWPGILASLQSQLDPATWRCQVGTYDWRFDLATAANSLAGNIRAHSTAVEPATIVAHSMGGLVAVLAWARLVASGDTALVRRIITIGTPFQGSYLPINFLNGLSPSQQQLLAMALVSQRIVLLPAVNWTLAFLNTLCLTWPAFYELFPAMGGSEAAKDPNRALLYNAANYPPAFQPSPAWLGFVLNGFQPGLAGPNTFPPDYVATYVYSTGIMTPDGLTSAAVPLNLFAIGVTPFGDGVVTIGSATRSPGKLVAVTGDHASLPLGITLTGLLAQLILDPRDSHSPPPSKLIVLPPIPANVTDPPQSDPISGLTCIGGHC